MWAIVDRSNNVALEAKSMISYNINDDSNVVSSSIEQGSFASYNKIDNPLQISVTLAFEGLPDEINENLAALKRLKKSTQLVGLQTDTDYIDNLNISSYSYSRSSDSGAYEIALRLVEILEVRNTVAQVKNPSSVTTENVGKVIAQRYTENLYRRTFGLGNG